MIIILSTAISHSFFLALTYFKHVSPHLACGSIFPLTRAFLCVWWHLLALSLPHLEANRQVGEWTPHSAFA